MSKKKKTIKEEIKQMETKKREEKSGPKKEEKKNAMVSFDSWWHKVKAKIKGRHPREVILADFKARGLGLKAEKKQYDEALRKYGIKLD